MNTPTGSRYRILDLRTGQCYDVEAIHSRRQKRPEFGDSLRERCAGSISESESRISEATHRNVRYVGNPSDYRQALAILDSQSVVPGSSGL